MQNAGLLQGNSPESPKCCGGCCSVWRGGRESWRPQRSPTVRPLLRMRWSKRPSYAGGSSAARCAGKMVGGELRDAVAAPLAVSLAGIVFKFAGARYTLTHELGRGAHCAVWKCVRLSSSGGEPHAFALKAHLALAGCSIDREATALAALGAGRGAGLFPSLLGHVHVLGRPCLAIPIYGPDLYALQKQRARQPFPAAFVWNVAMHLLDALAALACAGLVHADIKPQNVVVRRLTAEEEPRGAPLSLDGETQLCLIDLGSSLTREQLESRTPRTVYVQSRWYRAPEVLLGAQTTPNTLDCWSVGCVVAEVAVGLPVLPGESEYNQLARMCRLLGPPPRALVERALRSDIFLVHSAPARPSGAVAAPPYTMRKEMARHQPKLVLYLPAEPLAPLMHRAMPPEIPDAERRLLIGLVGGLLAWDPRDRLGAAQAAAALRAQRGDACRPTTTRTTA